MIWVGKSFWNGFGNGKWSLVVLLLINCGVWECLWIGLGSGLLWMKDFFK